MTRDGRRIVWRNRNDRPGRVPRPEFNPAPVLRWLAEIAGIITLAVGVGMIVPAAGFIVVGGYVVLVANAGD